MDEERNAKGLAVAYAAMDALGLPRKPIAWCPIPGPQADFIGCRADYKLIGGAAGGAKTDALLGDLLQQVEKPGFSGLYLRRNVPSMQDAYERSASFYPAAGGRWSKSERIWRFPSGARIVMRHLQYDETCQDFKSQQFAVIAFDELTTFTKYQFEYMSSRCRSTAPGVECWVSAATNPDGPGLVWVRDRFIDNRVPRTVYRRKMENGLIMSEIFIPSRLSDNPFLGAEYEARLMNLAEADRKALLDGDWYAYDGQVFSLVPGRSLLSLEAARTHWKEDEPPHWWPRFRVMDWGYAKPYACLWAAQDPQGRLWVYRELYGATSPNVGAKHSPAHVASLILSAEEKEAGVTSWAGPDLWAAGRGDYGSSRPLVEDFTDAGVYWTAPWAASAGTRRAKRQRLSAMLEANRGGLAEVVIVKDRCPALTRTLPALQFSRTDPEDVDTTAEDHAYDALAGLVMMRTWGGTDPEAPRPYQAPGDWMTS